MSHFRSISRSLPSPSSDASPELPGARSSARHQRRVLSCLPCRQHKLKCDRGAPCQSCTRYHREAKCLQTTSPATRGIGRVMIRSNTDSRNSDTTSTTWKLARDPPQYSALKVASLACSLQEETTSSIRSSDPGKATEASAPNPKGSVDLRCATRKSVSGLHLYNNVEMLKTYGDSASVHLPYMGGASAAPLEHLPFLANLCLQFGAFSGVHPVTMGGLLSSHDTTLYWKLYLASTLPSQTQCDVLVSFFFENLNWIYQAVHVPSFRKAYAQFWITDVADIDLIWLSLLYIMLCLVGLYIPLPMTEAIGFEPEKFRDFSHIWYSASRQALHAGGFGSKPALAQIQTFLLSQLYWYATKNVEVLNSNLGQTVRNAQALGLDKENSTMNPLEQEIRRRNWWDLISSDTFQSVCLGRPPLIQAHLCNVSFPSNCNDEDITEEGLHVRPIEQPTEMSMHVFRAQIFKVLNKLYINNGELLTSYKHVVSVDAEITQIMSDFPWYFQISKSPVDHRLSSTFSFLPWGHHMIHTCVSIQRIRMFRPFLHPLVHDSWDRCVQAATNALAVYKQIRAVDPSHFHRSQKFPTQNYQIFSVAVALAVFLLVEQPTNSEGIRADIVLIIEDLQYLEEADIRIPLVVDGRKVLKKILKMCDRRRRVDGAEPTALVPAIYSVFGGENTARKYLERCAIEYIINDKRGQDSAGPSEATFEVNFAPSSEPVSLGDINLDSDLSSIAYNHSTNDWDMMVDVLNWSQLDAL